MFATVVSIMDSIVHYSPVMDMRVMTVLYVMVLTMGESVYHQIIVNATVHIMERIASSLIVESSIRQIQRCVIEWGAA